MMSREQACSVAAARALLHIGPEREDSEGVRRGEQAARLTAAGEKAAAHAALTPSCEGAPPRPPRPRRPRRPRRRRRHRRVLPAARPPPPPAARALSGSELYARQFHFLVVSSNKALGTDPADAPAAAAHLAAACARAAHDAASRRRAFSPRTRATTAVVSPGGRKADGRADGGWWAAGHPRRLWLRALGAQLVRAHRINFTNERLPALALRAAFLARAAAYAAEGVRVDERPPPARRTTSSA